MRDMFRVNASRQSSGHIQTSISAANIYCPHCDRTVRVAVRFKQYYDRIDIRKTVSLVVPEPVDTEETAQDSEK